MFDPTVEAEVSARRNDSKSLNQSGSYTESSVNDVYQGNISFKEYFPTGTFVEAGAITRTTDSNLYNDLFSSTFLGLSVTQSLLRGYGTDVNLARLRQSRLETEITQYELRGFSESLLAQVETTYWDYALSQRQIDRTGRQEFQPQRRQDDLDRRGGLVPGKVDSQCLRRTGAGRLDTANT